MPERLRKLIGILLILAAAGVASGQALLVSCSTPATAGSVQRVGVAPD